MECGRIEDVLSESRGRRGSGVGDPDNGIGFLKVVQNLVSDRRVHYGTDLTLILR